MSESDTIGIVGAGAIGLACARALQREGHRVTLFDPSPAGEAAAAWGSAGILTPDMLNPLATPEVLSALPGMLMRSDAPLSLRWAHVPRALPCLLRFLANASAQRVDRNARALAAISSPAVPAWRELLEASERD